MTITFDGGNLLNGQHGRLRVADELGQRVVPLQSFLNGISIGSGTVAYWKSCFSMDFYPISKPSRSVSSPLSDTETLRKPPSTVF